MKRSQVVVVGAGYAGLLAAFRAAREPRAEVTLVDPKPAFVQRIRLHERLAGRSPVELPYGALAARRGLGFVRGGARGLDLARRELTVGPAGGGEVRLRFDHLVLALGSRTDLAAPGAREHALSLDPPAAGGDPDPLAAAAQRLPALAAARAQVLVIGAGLSGLEVATELAERWPGLRVRLLARGALAAGLYQAGAITYLHRRLAALGIALEEGVRVSALAAGAAHLADGSTRAFDLALWAAGMRPSPLPREWGLPVDATGRVCVTTELEVVGCPGLWAAGDAAAALAAGGIARLSCQAALPMGAHVGDAIARVVGGRRAPAFRFGFTLSCVSLGRTEGLAHVVHADDSPARTYFTGRAGAWIKEVVCRMTLAVVKAESHGLRVYHWKPAAPRKPAPVTAAA